MANRNTTWTTASIEALSRGRSTTGSEGLWLLVPPFSDVDGSAASLEGEKRTGFSFHAQKVSSFTWTRVPPRNVTVSPFVSGTPRVSRCTVARVPVHLSKRVYGTTEKEKGEKRTGEKKKKQENTYARAHTERHARANTYTQRTNGRRGKARDRKRNAKV